MTNDEAIKILAKVVDVCGNAVDMAIPGFLDAIEKAINALSEGGQSYGS